jgi:hypothetical protein
VTKKTKGSGGSRKIELYTQSLCKQFTKEKRKTIAVIIPEVADNFFFLAINGIQSVAETKRYQ